MPEEVANAVAEVVITAYTLAVRRATKYVSPTLIVRATRTLIKKKIDKRDFEVTLTIGKPNSRERNFIKDCKKAGEPFPVKKIQLQDPPKTKKK